VKSTGSGADWKVNPVSQVSGHILGIRCSAITCGNHPNMLSSTLAFCALTSAIAYRFHALLLVVKNVLMGEAKYEQPPLIISLQTVQSSQAALMFRHTRRRSSDVLDGRYVAMRRRISPGRVCRLGFVIVLNLLWLVVR